VPSLLPSTARDHRESKLFCQEAQPPLLKLSAPSFPRPVKHLHLGRSLFAVKNPLTQAFSALTEMREEIARLLARPARVCWEMREIKELKSQLRKREKEMSELTLGAKMKTLGMRSK
jgi:hypothetical protein